MPTLQEQAIKMTKESVTGLFRTARHVPEDKRTEWKPMGEARSVLNQLIECAGTPYFFASLLKGEPIDMGNPEFQAKRKQFEASITSLEAAEDAALKNYEMLYSVISSISDADLGTKCPVPWDPNCTYADVIFYAYWNNVYHIGQINYIQLLLGDTEMH